MENGEDQKPDSETKSDKTVEEREFEQAQLEIGKAEKATNKQIKNALRKHMISAVFASDHFPSIATKSGRALVVGQPVEIVGMVCGGSDGQLLVNNEQYPVQQNLSFYKTKINTQETI